MSTPKEIHRRLARHERFSLGEVHRWMEEEGDLELWEAVYELLTSGRELIRPQPELDETSAFATGYLLRCIRENEQSRDLSLPSSYEAAHELAACIKSWAGRLPETERILSDVAAMITAAYRRSSQLERLCLTNGMLEHALEASEVRRFFLRWKDDPELSESWRMAMEWAVAHGDPVE